MITSIRMVNFKNFVDETLRLGPFTVVVGTNASGKSNIATHFASARHRPRVHVDGSGRREVGDGRSTRMGSDTWRCQ